MGFLRLLERDAEEDLKRRGRNANVLNIRIRNCLKDHLVHYFKVVGGGCDNPYLTHVKSKRENWQETKVGTNIARTDSSRQRALGSQLGLFLPIWPPSQ
jgi:hypothetical protein